MGAAAYYYLFQNKADDAKVADLGNKDKTPPPADKDKPPPPLPDKDKPPPPPPPPPQGNKLRLALDSFSGYCIFRSDEFKKKLADQGVDFEYVDDNADYAARMKTVQSGDTPLAVFTIDALINNTPPPGDDPPAAIIMVIDETRGADAMIGLPPGMPSVDAAEPGLRENRPRPGVAQRDARAGGPQPVQAAEAADLKKEAI